MYSRDPLPTEEQRRQLGELMQDAFVELRYLTGQQAHDLADACHNIPRELYGWGMWSVSSTQAMLLHYQRKHRANLGFDYVAFFDKVFPQAP